MRIGALDFETVDPYLGMDMGPGWVYKLWVSMSQFKVIGYATCTATELTVNTAGDVNNLGVKLRQVTEPVYRPITDTSKQDIAAWIADHDYICFHNAPYDLGCLLALGINIASIKVLDTKILAKLHNSVLADETNNKFAYSLDSLSKLYLPPEHQKKKGALSDIVIKHRLGPLMGLSDVPTVCKKTGEEKPTQLQKKLNTKTCKSACEKWAYSNMDVLQDVDFDSVAYYACQDVVATINLLMYFWETVPFRHMWYFSGMTKNAVMLRKKGLKIDIQKIKDTIPVMEEELVSIHKAIEKHIHSKGLTCPENLNSARQLAKVMRDMGYKLPVTDKGNDSTNAKWLAKNATDPFIAAIIEYRTTFKILHDFLIKPLEWQQYCCPEALVDGAKYGRLFPEINVLGATATGRTSCSTPSEQNIPKRNAKWGKLCRSIFLPEDDSKHLFVLDYANQEGRLQVNDAAIINAPGGREMLAKWTKDPMMDLHQEVANLANITRAQAKPINLGISYGKMAAALAEDLGLPTVIKRAKAGYMYTWAGPEAEAILRKYHAALPYIQCLIDSAKETLINNGYIVTIDGRKLRRSPDGRDYTGISKRIQGSAGDVAYKAWAEADEQGIDIKLFVHDEFVIEGTLEDARRMAKIMENTHPTKIKVPMPVEVKYGKNWGELTAIPYEVIHDEHVPFTCD